MNDAEYNRLLEKSWHQPLTPAEEAMLQSRLPGNPEGQTDLDADRALTQILRELPDAPVPSNFTALVMQAVDREAAKAARSQSWAERLRGFFRRPATGLAWASAAAIVVFIGVQQRQSYQQAQVHAQFADSVLQVSSVASLPDPTMSER